MTNRDELAALILMTDPDIDGWRGLASTSALWSVALYGLLGCALFFLCLKALLTAGRSGFLFATAFLSLCLGLVLTILGSGATTIVGRAETFAACTGVVFAAVLLAVVPAAALGWPQSGADEPAGGNASVSMSAEPPREGRT